MADQPERELKGRRRKRLALAASVVLVVGGVALLWQALRDEKRPARVAAEAEPAAPLPVAQERKPRKEDPPSDKPRVRLPPGRKPADGPAVARVIIPSIGVRAPVITLGLNQDKTLQVPADVHKAGLWDGVLTGGRKGPPVVVGHVDSRSGPGVFHDLPRLSNGERVTLTTRRGGRTTYAVTGRMRVRKNSFPTSAVYHPTRRAEIRLITCTGDFNQAAGHYRDNLIVFGRKV